MFRLALRIGGNNGRLPMDLFQLMLFHGHEHGMAFPGDEWCVVMLRMRAREAVRGRA